MPDEPRDQYRYADVGRDDDDGAGNIALAGARNGLTDETGLTGDYEVSLTYAPERSRLAARSPEGDPGERPSLFTAVQEQLGLKLESRRGPVPVLVIDRIERPADD